MATLLGRARMSDPSDKRVVIPIVAGGGDAAVEMRSMYQAQQKIYPRSVTGWFAAWRWGLVWATQLLFYGLPWLAWNGRQAGREKL